MIVVLKIVTALSVKIIPMDPFIKIGLDGVDGNLACSDLHIITTNNLFLSGKPPPQRLLL